MGCPSSRSCLNQRPALVFDVERQAARWPAAGIKQPTFAARAAASRAEQAIEDPRDTGAAAALLLLLLLPLLPCLLDPALPLVLLASEFLGLGLLGQRSAVENTVEDTAHKSGVSHDLERRGAGERGIETDGGPPWVVWEMFG